MEKEAATVAVAASAVKDSNPLEEEPSVPDHGLDPLRVLLQLAVQLER